MNSPVIKGKYRCNRNIVMSIVTIFSVEIDVIKELEIKKQLIKKNKMGIGDRESNKE